MLPYIISLLTALVGGWLTKHAKLSPRKKKFFMVLLMSIPLVVISAFRYDIGTDYSNYENIFLRLKYGNYFQYYGTKELEPLYVLLNNVLIWLNLDVQWLFVITSVLYVFIIVYSITELSTDMFFSVFLLFGTTAFFDQMNTMRQHVACAFLLLALIHLMKERRKLFIVFVVIASLWHYTSLFFLILFIVTRIKARKEMVIGVVAALVVAEPIMLSLIRVVLSPTLYETYLGNADLTGSGYLGLLVQIMIFIVMTIYYDNSDKYRMMYYLMAMNLVATAYLDSVPLIARFRWMFYYPVIVCGLPMALSNIKQASWRTLIKMGVVLCFAAYAFITIVVNKGYGVYPYQWIFD